MYSRKILHCIKNPFLFCASSHQQTLKTIIIASQFAYIFIQNSGNDRKSLAFDAQLHKNILQKQQKKKPTEKGH